MFLWIAAEKKTALHDQAVYFLRKKRELIRQDTREVHDMAEDEVKKTEEQDPYDVKQYHEVKKGDTLWKIAEKYYGDGNLYKQIFEANRDILKKPDVIKIGQKLHIP